MINNSFRIFPPRNRVLTAPITAVFAILLTLATGNDVATASPEIPGAASTKPVAIVGATIHPVTGDVIDKGTLIFKEGKIVAAAADAQIPDGAEKIDGAGKHVYPGMIDAYTQLGLVEIPSVRGSRDEAEAGEINPNVRAQVAFNPDSEILPVERASGILTAIVAPRGGMITGTSALMSMDGWTWEDMTVVAPLGMHVSWPRWVPIVTFLARETENTSTARRDKALATLQQAFDDARAYKAAKEDAARTQSTTFTPDARWDAMLPVIDRQVPLVAEADELQQIQSAVAFALRQNAKLILLGGYDAPLCSELLKQHDIPVVIGGVHRLPLRSGDPYDAPYSLAARLKELGVRFCIASHCEVSRARNLPYHAATAAAYGLDPIEALKSVTIYPAQILGVDRQLGSLEPGKDATLIVTSGDPLETSTQVEMAFIQGRPVDLNNRQKRLWNKYQEKYRRLEQPSAK